MTAQQDPHAQPLGFSTLCAHFGEQRHAHHGAAAAPIFQTSTFVYPDTATFEGRLNPEAEHHDYTRRSNPTTAILEAKLAELERGTWARLFASGMGAITAAINVPLAAGAHVVACEGCYNPAHKYLASYLPRFGVQTTFVRGTDPRAFVAAMRPETKLLYLESPTSARHEVLELAPLIDAARQRGVVTIFDNSWATPYFQNPLELGSDLVVHSCTKYIGGHSDTLGGAVVGRDAGLRRRVLDEAELLGASADPLAAWLLLRGLRTLPLRMEQHQASALRVARFLAGHPRVQRVYYPGLEDSPGHAVARRQLRGFSSLFSFALREQTRDAVHKFLDRLKLFGIGCSWGGYESLALGGPAGTLFSADPDEPSWILRLHIGLEGVDDLLADLRQALED